LLEFLTTSKMKKNIATILLLLLVTGCIKEYETSAWYKIKNISNHEVKIKIFHFYTQYMGAGNIDSTFILSLNSEIEYFYKQKCDRKGPEENTVEPFIDADSAYIIFDGSYRISYRQTDSNPRNILHMSSYAGGKTDKRIFKYQYYITDEDYKNAVKIK
jgi:hypothetical protein